MFNFRFCCFLSSWFFRGDRPVWYCRSPVIERVFSRGEPGKVSSPERVVCGVADGRLPDFLGTSRIQFVAADTSFGREPIPMVSTRTVTETRRLNIRVSWTAGPVSENVSSAFISSHKPRVQSDTEQIKRLRFTSEWLNALFFLCIIFLSTYIYP